jgi:glutaredoxin
LEQQDLFGDVTIVSAQWCRNCQPVKETLQQLSDEKGFTLKVLDADDHNTCEETSKVMEDNNVRGVPTIVFNGKTLVGSKTKKQIEEFLGV